MSFTEAPVASTPVESAPAPVATGSDSPTAGSVDAVGTSVDAATSAQEPVGTETPSGDLYEVKVGDQVQQVTLDELRNGFMRQADYTRKTQEVAAQRSDLQQAAALMAAFERDPHATLTALSEAYNWTPQQTAAAGQALENGSADLGEIDPLEQRLSQVEQFAAAQQRQATQQAIENDFQTLESEYGEIDRQAVINHAIAKGTDLVTAYRDMQFDVVRKNNAAALQAKREAQVVEGAGTVQPGTVSAPPAKSPSLRDTIRAAVLAASQ